MSFSTTWALTRSAPRATRFSRPGQRWSSCRPTIPTSTAATSLHEAIDIDAAGLELLRDHLPDFRFVLDDLAQRSDAEIRAREMAVLGRLALLLLRHVREARNSVEALQSLIGRLADLVRSLPARVDRLVVITYILNVADADRSRVESALADALPELKEDVVTVADQIRIEAERAMFLRMLRRRFELAVSSAIEEQIRAADKATLDLWTDRFVAALKLEEIFKKG